MSDALSSYLAGEIIDWLAQDDAFDAPPDTLYVSVEDATQTDRSGDLSDAPKAVASADWTRTNTAFENAVDVDLGEATADIEDVTYATIYDGADPGTANLLLSVDLDDTPFTVSEGTNLIWDGGDISFDAVEFSP